MLGTILINDDGSPRNSVIVWDPKRGITDRYDKHIIQPFGEYLPWRGFFRLFSSYADVAGTFTPAAVRRWCGYPTRQRSRHRRCRDMLGGGLRPCRAGLGGPGRTGAARPDQQRDLRLELMTYQQLAMSQVRAVEHGRTVLVAATSRVSAIIAPDGDHHRAHPLFVPATLSDRVPLRTQRTLPPGWAPFRPSSCAWSRSRPFWRRWRRILDSVGAARGPCDRWSEGASMSKVIGPTGENALVVILTYNESENLPIIVERLLNALVGVHVLVVDDSSPDGTGEDRRWSCREGRSIHVLHRTEKDRLGKAYLAGFTWDWPVTTRCSSRWMPTARTRQSSCTGSSTRSMLAPTWRSGPAT